MRVPGALARRGRARFNLWSRLCLNPSHNEPVGPVRVGCGRRHNARTMSVIPQPTPHVTGAATSHDVAVDGGGGAPGIAAVRMMRAASVQRNTITRSCDTLFVEKKAVTTGALL